MGGQVEGSPNLAPNSILMALVDLDVHQIVGYHYFESKFLIITIHQPFRGSSVRLFLGWDLEMTKQHIFGNDQAAYIYVFWNPNKRAL